MYNLGVKHVTCLDIGDEWKGELSKILSKYKIPTGFCDFVSGTTTELPFSDETFDFVASNGVLMHLETVDMASVAIKELSRVARGGGAFTHTSALTIPVL
jgi:ubiquinone/menaquinone biosynthesis C-methylase UbiE